MGLRRIITNKGMELLASASSSTSVNYWLGYYALAYVPNFWKDDDNDNLIDIPNCPDQEVNPTGDPQQGPFQITINDHDKLNANMTKLTENGDIIWNVFQGDLVGEGFLDGLSDGSPAGNLFGLTLYGANVKKHYRYVLDENGNNNLVCWTIDPVDSELMLGAYRYRGTDGFVSSSIPVPAPLFYLGDASKDNTIENPPFSITQYINDYALNTGADTYPKLNVDVSASLALFLGDSTLDIPRVSLDFRSYLDFIGNDANSPLTPGIDFDSNEIPAANPSINNVNGWFDAESTRNGLPSKIYSDEFYKLISISNYNRYHAPVGNLGDILNSDLKNRNMAKVTKLFPIFNYGVINSQRGLSSDGETREVATGISLTIDLNLSQLLKTQGYNNYNSTTGTAEYNEENDLTLQNRYNNPSNVDDMFNTTHTSFKFNRIGIYAVPVRKAPGTQIQDPLTEGRNVAFEVEIDPESEPILFAVVDFDNTQYLSDTGDGAHQFRAEINVNLESPDGVDETPLVRDTAIFYNLYHDSSITWFRNQLLANASSQHAIIELQHEILNLRTRLDKASVAQCCPSNTGVSGSSGVPSLLNLVDSIIPSSGGVRQLNAYQEAIDLDAFTYYLGDNATALGNNTAAMSPNSFTTGLNNYIVGNDAVNSSIIGGNNNKINNNSENSIIAGSIGATISNSIGSAILAHNTFYVLSDSSYSAIIGGTNTSLLNANSSLVLGGSNHILNGLNNSVILGGTRLTATRDNQVVMGKNNNELSPSAGVGSLLVIGDGPDVFTKRNAFSFMSFDNSYGAGLNGKTSLYIRDLPLDTNPNFANLPSGCLYIANFDGSIKVKP